MVSCGRGTVLCVDDDPNGLELRKRVLESAGYRVLIAMSAEAALKLFDSEDIDVVLTDHFLRGKSGTTLAAEMKQRKPKIAVAVYSGIQQAPEDISNADAFITKLVSPEELLAYIDTTIAAQRKA